MECMCTPRAKSIPERRCRACLLKAIADRDKLLQRAEAWIDVGAPCARDCGTCYICRDHYGSVAWRKDYRELFRR